MARFRCLVLLFTIAGTCSLGLADPQQVMLQCSQAALIAEELFGGEASNECAKSCLSLHSLRQLNELKGDAPPCRSVCQAYEETCGVKGRCDRYPIQNCAEGSGVADVQRLIQPWAMGYRYPQGFPLVGANAFNSTYWKTESSSIYACYNWLYYLPIDCDKFDWVSSSCMVVREFSPVNCESAGCCADFRQQMLFVGSGFHTEVSGSNGPTTRMNLYPAGYGCYSDDKPMYCANYSGASNQKCAVYGYPRWQFDNFISVNGVACNSILGEPARDQCCMLIETVWQSFEDASFREEMHGDSSTKKLADEMVFQF